MNLNKGIGSIIIGLLIVLSLFWIFESVFFNNNSTTTTMYYSDFIKRVESDTSDIAEITIKDDGNIVLTTISGRKYNVYAPWVKYDMELINNLVDKGIRVGGEKGVDSSFWVNIVGNLLFFVLMLFMFGFLIRGLGRGNNQAFSFTKSRAEKVVPGKKRVTFKDVAGVDEAVEELQEIVDFLKNPSKFNKIGARMPKGVLLVGPPGTGKTLLARAVAGEANVPFFHISGSDFVELFVGVGAARVRDLFNQAKANAPCIVFIDEIDAVGRHRGAGLGGGHDEREQTLNQLLVEMDGFDVREGIIVMAATNRPDILDPALLRPGRFDKKVVVDPPDVKGREEILRIHLRGKPIDDDVDVKVLAKRTTGFVGADLENLINEAALLAAKDGRDKMKMFDFEEAIDRVIAGPARKSRIISQKQKEIVAYHELGHAIVGTALPNSDPVHKVSIIPRGHSALGFTLHLPVEDKYLISKNELLDNITALLGGRAAEELVFGDVTSGAANDIERATEMARKMVCELGMSDNFGPLSWGKSEQEISKLIDSEVQNIVNSCYNKAKEILIKRRKKLDELAKILLEKEEISGEELRELLKGDEGNVEEHRRSEQDD